MFVVSMSPRTVEVGRESGEGGRAALQKINLTLIRVLLEILKRGDYGPPKPLPLVSEQ